MREFRFQVGCDHLSFEFEAKNLLFHAPPGLLPRISDEKQVILDALRRPIRCKPLRDLVSGKRSVAIVVDDLTRTTPQSRILPLLLGELNEAGIPDQKITLVIALGTHRPMTDTEIRSRFGATADAVKILNHDCRMDGCVDLGVTARGTPIQINRIVCEAEARISVGTVVPHPLAGWGGGAKMIQPGVSSELTTDCTHFLGGTYERPLDLVGNPDNFIRQEMESVVARVGLDFILNTVQDLEGNLVGVFAGDQIMAHRAAVRCAERIFRPEIPALADIVICNAHPADLDYWQGFKPFVYSHLAVKEGGTIILAIGAPEGVSGGAPKHHETLLRWSTQSPERILKGLESGEIEDRNAGAICVAQARLLERAHTICVSPGLKEEEIAALGFTPARSLGRALEGAVRRHGGHASVGVIPYAGETIVRVKT